MIIRIICLLIGYCFGLFQTGYIYGKVNKIDIREHGSGNSGVTNSLRVMGWKAGVIVAFGDCFKTIIAMTLVWFLFKNNYIDCVKLFMLYTAFGTVLGHNFPFYMKFKGGKGIACSVGTVFGFDWRMFPICTISFFLPIIPTGYMSLGSLCMISALFIQTVVFGQLGILKIGASFLPETYILMAVITGMGFFQHRANIKRLATGTEKKFKPKSKNDK